METAELAPGLLAELERHARGGHPREACGSLAGRRIGSRLQLVAFFPAQNVHPHLRAAFELDPGAVVAAEARARAAGLALVGFFHSHPDRPPHPSPEDAAGGWEGFLALITAVSARGRTETRAHLLWSGGFRALALR